MAQSNYLFKLQQARAARGEFDNDALSNYKAALECLSDEPYNSGTLGTVTGEIIGNLATLTFKLYEEKDFDKRIKEIGNLYSLIIDYFTKSDSPTLDDLEKMDKMFNYRTSTNTDKIIAFNKQYNQMVDQISGKFKEKFQTRYGKTLVEYRAELKPK